jgi:hypothetical protein
VSAQPPAKKTASLIEKETDEVSSEQLKNFKSQITNIKQITMTEIQNSKQALKEELFDS